MSKRIISISSGKGGVGKTSFAINLALAMSRQGRTILLDLDTGTSSIRNVIDTPVKKDLYHFFKKGADLGDCVTQLGPATDRAQAFKNFGFVASPLHMIDAIANMNADYRNQLIDAVNKLRADYIILDLKAGVDPGVMDFLPQSNTGILVFTPNHPAATMAASDITKAILFRKLRALFHVGSPIYERFPSGRLNPAQVNAMLDQTEDVYEEELPNLDAFIEALAERVPGHPIQTWMTNMVEYFRVYYVLNRFSNLEDSFDTAIKPFVENITQHVSSRVNISNLGWIKDSQTYHQANTKRIPFLLQLANKKAKPQRSQDAVESKLSELYKITGLRKEKPDHTRLASKPKKKAADELQTQLRALETMYKNKSKETEKQNFDYVVSSIRYLFSGKRVSDFGDIKLFKPGELVNHIVAQIKNRQEDT